MGVLNVTPDSYFAPSRKLSLEDAVSHALALQEQGADIIDIGGESTRPTVKAYGENVDVSVEEEIGRTIPVIKALSATLKVPISIDTIKWQVAEAALEAGASMINDVTGFRDPAMRRLAAQSGAEICVMHMQGTPKTMQQNPHYPQGVVNETLQWLEGQLDLLLQAGVSQNKIIIDPGIGFGKSADHILEILQRIADYKKFGCKVLVGASRKLFMAKLLGKTADELLASTLAVCSYLVLAGVDIIRVHDVKEHRDAVDILSHLQAAP